MKAGYILVKLNTSINQGWMITHIKTRISLVDIPHSSCRALLRKNMIEEDKNNKKFFGTVYRLVS